MKTHPMIIFSPILNATSEEKVIGPMNVALSLPLGQERKKFWVVASFASEEDTSYNNVALKRHVTTVKNSW